VHKTGAEAPLLRKKGAPANFLRGSRQMFDTENTDRVSPVITIPIPTEKYRFGMLLQNCHEKGVDYAIRVKSYNPLFRMVARIFSYIILHVPTYLGKGASPMFSDLDSFGNRLFLY